MATAFSKLLLTNPTGRCFANDKNEQRRRVLRCANASVFVWAAKDQQSGIFLRGLLSFGGGPALVHIVRLWRRSAIPRENGAIKSVAISLRSFLDGLDAAIENEGEARVQWVRKNRKGEVDIAARMRSFLRWRSGEFLGVGNIPSILQSLCLGGRRIPNAVKLLNRAIEIVDVCRVCVRTFLFCRCRSLRRLA